MADKRLLEFVRTNLRSGYHVEDIEKTLVESGWSEDIVHDAVELVLQQDDANRRSDHAQKQPPKKNMSRLQIPQFGMPKHVKGRYVLAGIAAIALLLIVMFYVLMPAMLGVPGVSSQQKSFVMERGNSFCSDGLISVVIKNNGLYPIAFPDDVQFVSMDGIGISGSIKEFVLEPGKSDLLLDRYSCAGKCTEDIHTLMLSIGGMDQELKIPC